MKAGRVLIAMFAGIFAASAAFGAVTDEVKRTVDEVVRIVEDKEMKKPQNRQKRRIALKESIGRAFGYREMTKRALAGNWNTLTPQQQKEVTDLFAALLEKTYAGKIESYNNEKIVYVREDVEKDYAEVKSKVVTPRGEEYTLDYRLVPEGGRWIVYDVIIEGISLVSNYRTQFNKIMRDEGYPGLVKKLKSKAG